MGQLTFTITPIRSSWPWPWPTMNVASINIHPTAIFFKFSHLSPQFRKPAITAITAASFRASAVPARDRVVDFGKYKGRMLGSLPSTYLKWISKNLRAGDMEEWARLSDNVLADSVYRDRIEWEEAERILSGDEGRYSSGGNAAAELAEISERFGWDNEDKSGWSKVDFALLGTSRGGRIPRAAAERSSGGVRVLKKGNGGEVEEGGGRRRERRERVRRLRQEKTTATEGERREEGGGPAAAAADGGGVKSPFPGREALLKKVLNRQSL